MTDGPAAPEVPRTLRRKMRWEVGWRAEAGLPQMGPVHYLPWMRDLHAELAPRAYFEIGTESGASLSFANCLSIAVDPQFRLEADMSRNKPELHLFQGTSDDFFASNLLGRLGVEIDLAFLDGMHLFEFLLRDFIGVERHMNAGGVVLMHDCAPATRLMAEREWDKTKTASWTGDVWKTVAILREHRPDLEVTVLDLAPTGIVQIRNLDPGNAVLSERYDDIVARWMGETIDSFGAGRFCRLIDLRHVAPPEKTGVIAIKTCIPETNRAFPSGDGAFGASLAAAMEEEGVETRVDDIDAWAGAAASDSVDLILQGHDSHPPRPGVPAYLWLIYPGKRFDLGRLPDYRRVFVASRIHAERLAAELPAASISYLPQAFDAGIMRPPEAGAKREGVVFVGNNHFGRPRPVVRFAHEAGAAPRIWGGGWEETPYASCLQGEGVDNRRLGDIYRAAEVVLCDHTRTMARNGYLSNRIYDALACGAPVISDSVQGFPEEFAPFVRIVDSAASFDEALRAIRAETEADRERRLDFARSMADRHSFAARARDLLERIREDGAL